MGLIDLRNKYGKESTHKLLNRAIRAEIPGGSMLLDAAETIHVELGNPRHNRSPEEMYQLRTLRDELGELLDRLRRGIRVRYGISVEPREVAAGASVGESQRAALAAVPLPPRDPEDRDWRPPAAIVERMGKDSDASLAAECGVSAHMISDCRRRLGIEPARRAASAAPSSPTSWTPEMDAVLGTRGDAELGAMWGISGETVRRRRVELGVSAKRAKVEWTDGRLRVLANAGDSAAAAKLQISVASVKTARSRYKDQIAKIRSEK